MQALLMSNLVFGGGSLFVTLSLWVAPLPVVAIVLTTLVVNVRYLLTQQFMSMLRLRRGQEFETWLSALPATPHAPLTHTLRRVHQPNSSADRPGRAPEDDHRDRGRRRGPHSPSPPAQ